MSLMQQQQQGSSEEETDAVVKGTCEGISVNKAAPGNAPAGASSQQPTVSMLSQLDQTKALGLQPDSVQSWAVVLFVAMQRAKQGQAKSRRQ